MRISTYARQVGFSDRTIDMTDSKRIFFLGLIGEIGSILAECKKTLREGKDNRSNIHEKLCTELGDSLWYLAAITLKYELNIRTDVIEANLNKILEHDDCPKEVIPDFNTLRDNFPNRLPEDFNQYQDLVWLTAAESLQQSEDELLARLIRKASQFMRYYTNNRRKEKDERSETLERYLGDLLWYIAIFSKQQKIELNEIASRNYDKTVNRWRVNGEQHSNRLDIRDPVEERLPDIMTFRFQSIENDQIEIIYEEQNIKIGNPLDDNTTVADGYRFHDAFHMAFAAILTWSPVLRKLLRIGEGEDLNKNKRYYRFSSQKSHTEDGARAQIVEEAIAKIVHSHAFEVDEKKLLSEKNTISTELLDQIKIFTRNLEVDCVTQWEWEIAIIEACKIYVQLRENQGGKVILNLKDRSIAFEKCPQAA